MTQAQRGWPSFLAGQRGLLSPSSASSCSVSPHSATRGGSDYSADLTHHFPSLAETSHLPGDAYKRSIHTQKLHYMKPLLVNVRGFVLSSKSNQNVQLSCPANSWGRAILLSLLIFQAFFWRTLLFKLTDFFWVGQEILKVSRCIVEKINSEKWTCVLGNSESERSFVSSVQRAIWF